MHIPTFECADASIVLCPEGNENMDPLLAKIYRTDLNQIEICEKQLMVGGGTRGGQILTRGKGVRVWDIDGKEYIDCTSQSWALYLGHANEEINQIICEHIGYMSHAHQGFDTLPRYYLANKLSQLAPDGINRVSFTVGGGPAIEAAMKICIKNVQPSRDFICLHDSYAGTTLGVMGASWISTKSRGQYLGASNLLMLTRPFIRIPNPDMYRNPFGVDAETYTDMCVTMARETLQRGVAGKPAGIIVEPIQCSAGQIILPKRYLQALRNLCDEFETLLVFDEIQTFARIGEFFAAKYFDVSPDIIVLGKGLGAGLPLAGIIISDRLEGFSPADWEEVHTFSHPTLSMITAAKQIEMLEEGVLENCRKMGAYLKTQLKEMAKVYPEMGDIRQAGLHIGIEFVKDLISKEPISDKTIQIRNAGLKHGIIFGLGGVRRNVLKVKPPLIISKVECDEVLEKLERSIKDVLRI